MPADYAMKAELRDHARTMASSLGLSRDTGTAMADRLATQYSAWPRRYHDARHLLACVRAAEQVRDVIPEADTAIYALWFHDAVYRPWRRDNEKRSADQARRSAVNLRLGGSFADRVHALVMATAHLAGGAQRNDDETAAWVLDIDLGILGAPEAAYDRYERDVRREYFHVMPAAWRKGRAAVLRHFLDQPRIYRTDHFFHLLEKQARSNLERSLAALAV